MDLKMTREDIEEAYETLSSEGWDIVIEKYFKPLIEAKHDQLVESSQSEDEAIKGEIRALKRYILPLMEEFKVMRAEVMKSEEVGKKKK